MRLEGSVQVVIPMNPDEKTTVSYQDPFDVSMMVRGKRRQEVLKLVPALFSLCGTAHAAAAAQAFDRATNASLAPEQVAIRDALVRMERVREHILRISLSWPILNQREADSTLAKVAMSLLPDFAKAVDERAEIWTTDALMTPDWAGVQGVIERARQLVEDSILGRALEDWLSLCSQTDICSWAKSGELAAPQLIAALFKKGWSDLAATDVEYLSCVARDLNGRRHLDGHASVPEATVLDSRKYHSMLRGRPFPTLLKRYLARLVDLAETMRELESFSRGETAVQKPSPGAVGIGTAATARGRLTHLVHLEGEIVTDYRIVSPTRWNFAENGSVAKSLNALPNLPAGSRKLLSEWVIGAFDPCIRYSVRVH